MYGAEGGDEDAGSHAAMFLAVEEGRLEDLQLLIADGADVKVEDCHGRTPLHFAVAMGHEAVTQMLLDAGADVAAECSEVGMALNAAARGFRKDTTCHPCISGRTPLHLAAMLSSEIVVHQLLDAGADAAAEDTTGCIPLHLACQRGRESIAQILLDAFPGVTAKNNSGWTPLHFAAKKGLETSAQVSPPEPET